MKPSAETNSAFGLVYYSLNFVDGALPWLRFRGPAQYLGWTAIPGNEWTQVWPEKVAEADLVVIQRDFPRLEMEFAQVLHQAAAQGKPVILDLDDLLLDLPSGHPDREDNYYAGALLPVIKALSQVDLVTVSTPQLAELLRPLRPDIDVLPNLLDERLWSPPATLRESGEPVTIAYWGGSSHSPDLAWLAPALERLLLRFAGVSVQIWGPALPLELQRINSSRVTRAPLEIYRYADYADFIRRQVETAGVDLVIAPLIDNRFNRCKSGIKFLENSALGLPGVYSRLEPYTGLVTDGVNGLLADSLDTWEAALARLVQDADLRRRLGRQAQQTVRADWLMSAHASRWQQVYAQALAAALSRKAPGGIPWESDLLYRVAEQLHQAYLNGKRSILDGPADTNPSARLWQAEKELQAAQERLAEVQRSRAWKVLQPFWRWRAALQGKARR